VTLGRILGALIPESPARTAGEQLRLEQSWRKFVQQLPTTPENTPDNQPPK
jgi:hypothetical protein